MSACEIVEADLDREDHQRAVLALTAAYGLDPFGSGAPLPDEALARLIDGLRAHPTTMVFLAYVDGRAVGIANCFRGFSTFTARPLINIHDLAVLPDQRGAGIGRRLLEAVERKARALGCCKLTLETQEHNARARGLYESFGFATGDGSSRALFHTKAL